MMRDQRTWDTEPLAGSHQEEQLKSTHSKAQTLCDRRKVTAPAVKPAPCRFFWTM